MTWFDIKVKPSSTGYNLSALWWLGIVEPLALTTLFAKEVNTSEHQVMLNFRKDHLTNAEVGKVNTLSKGVFDIAVMKKLLTKLGASLVYYEPNAMVKSYLYQHANSLGWTKDKLNFNNPRDKDSKRKRLTTKDDVTWDAKSKRSKPNTSKVAKSIIVTKACCAKGNQTNHSHQDCRFKTNDRPSPSDNKRHEGPCHPNSKLVPPAVGSANKQETRTCYVCNKQGHIAPKCPDKAANKQNPNKKLFTNKNLSDPLCLSCLRLFCPVLAYLSLQPLLPYMVCWLMNSGLQISEHPNSEVSTLL